MSTSDGSTRNLADTNAQPAPERNEKPAVWSLVMRDMTERDIFGAEKYGTRLQPGNGRDFLLDAYQEALDLVVYLRGAIYERDEAATVKESLTVHPVHPATFDHIDPADVEISEKQACSVSADEHADMLARFDKRRAELLWRGSCESNVTVLPDGSAFGVMSFPLSRGHWLYADRAYEDGADQPKELPAPILNHGSRDTVVAAARYAVRGATNCGKEPDFDPDALVQNVVYALCGPYGRVEPIPVGPADVEIASAIDDDSERMQAIGQNGNGGEHYGAPDWSKAPDDAALYIDWTGSSAGFESAFYCDGGDRFYRIPLRTGTPVYVLKLENGFPDIDYPYFMRPAK